MTDLLTLHKVTVAYGAVRAIDQLNLHIQTGTRHAIIGPNGAGKSTLINTITGIVRPSSGNILFNDIDITTWPAHRRARAGIGRTWQHAAVHDPLTALDNALIAVPGQPLAGRAHRPGAVTAAQQALTAVGLADHSHTQAAHLPYGQRRLLEIAVALAAKPQLLLLDEPSAGLSDTDTARLADLIRALPANVTMLLIDHNLDFVNAVTDTVTVLHHGRVLTTGTPDQIRNDPLTRTAYPCLDTTPHTRRPTQPAADTPTLAVRALRAAYTDTPVLTNIHLDLHPGRVLAVVGRNGAGKTTLLNTIAGLHPAAPPTTITLAGTTITEASPRARVHAGLALVPQGRRLFHTLTVDEHLTVARAPGTRPALFTTADLHRLLPALATRRHHRPTQLSGGEQQMLAIARALLTNPRVLLLDEPSEGLAPTVLTHLAAIITRLAEAGVAILLAEQNLTLALTVADQIAVLHHHGIALHTSAANLSQPGCRQQLDNLLGLTAAPPDASGMSAEA